MTYEVLCPVAPADEVEVQGINPRLPDLSHKTIGLFASFKAHWVYILDEIGKQLQAKHPGITLKRFQYTKDLNSYTQVAEVAKDSDVRPQFEQWIKECDAVVVANADAGSCTLYLAYNAAIVERLGKPGVLTIQTEFMPIARSALALRGVPAMRMVDIKIHDISMEPDLSEWTQTIIPQRVAAVMDQIVDALTRQLTSEEISPLKIQQEVPRIATKGSLAEVHEHFYRQGWCPGSPIVPPTEAAVKEMLRGTDLQSGEVIACIPPKNGKATVEKIAVNAVMAGCVPTHLPVLIAAVRAMTDPRMWLEAYTCSMASWMPMLILNGPIRKDLGINCSTSYMSPYTRANACIGRALGLIIMNIAGVRAGIEDMGVVGHEGHFGVCIGEHEEASPWEPMHEFYGFSRDDSAATIFFPNTRTIGFGAKDPGVILKAIGENAPLMGFDPGCAIIMTPQTARALHGAGMSRQDVIDYIVEYSRRPATELNVRWMKGNWHIPKFVPLPLDTSRSVRKFMSHLHLPILVAGNEGNWGGALYGGGGDHGGPITKKIDLPKHWDALLKEYPA